MADVEAPTRKLQVANARPEDTGRGLAHLPAPAPPPPPPARRPPPRAGGPPPAAWRMSHAR